MKGRTMEYRDKHDIYALADECYPHVSFGPTRQLEVTTEQAQALFRKWKQEDQGIKWGDFAKAVLPTFFCDDAVTVQWSGMWLCIETDGYCHT